MDENVLNLEIRKFLTEVGITSQRKIEQAIAEALHKGELKESDTVKARMVLTLEGIGLRHEVEGSISLQS